MLISICGAVLAFPTGALAQLPPLPEELQIPLPEELQSLLPGGTPVLPGGVPVPAPGGVQTPTLDGLPVPCLSDAVLPETPLNPDACGSQGGAGDASGTPAPGSGSRTRPRVSVRVPRQRMRVVLTRGLKVRVRSSQAGALAVRVTLPARAARRLGLGTSRPVVVGRARGQIARPGSKPLRVKLSRRARKALRRVRFANVQVRGRATDSAGNIGRSAVRSARLKR
jgi:hypothetical protein